MRDWSRIHKIFQFGPEHRDQTVLGAWPSGKPLQPKGNGTDAVPRVLSRSSHGRDRQGSLGGSGDGGARTALSTQVRGALTTFS